MHLSSLSYVHAELIHGRTYYYQLAAVNTSGEGTRTTVLQAIPHPPLGARDSSKDFNTLSAAENTFPRGLWSNGTTLWVIDAVDDKIYAYNLATKHVISARTLTPSSLREIETLTTSGRTALPCG